MTFLAPFSQTIHRCMPAILATSLFLVGADQARAQRIGPAGVGAPPAAVATFPAEAARIHVVLLVDSSSKEIGFQCGQDVLAFKNTLIAGLREKSDRLVFHDFTGNYPMTTRPWLPGEVYQRLCDLPKGENETLVIFHSGHGSIRNRNFPEKTHFLGLNGGMISLGAIYDSLRGRTYRSMIVLTDCCSSIVGGPNVAFARQRINGAETVNSESVLNLFVRSIGEVSITAAEDGTTAKASFQGPNPANAGSAFTVALLRLLYDNSRTFRAWSELFPLLQNETYEASGHGHRARAFIIDERFLTQPGNVMPSDVRETTSKPDVPRNLSVVSAKPTASAKPTMSIPRELSRSMSN